MRARLLTLTLLTALLAWVAASFVLMDSDEGPLLRVQLASDLAGWWLLSGLALLVLIVAWSLRRPAQASRQQAQDTILATYVTDGVIFCTHAGRIRWHNQAADPWVKGNKLLPELRDLVTRAHSSRRMTLQVLSLGGGPRYAVQAIPTEAQQYALVLRPVMEQGSDNPLYDNFIRRIVHDMRNPLAGIIGHAANLSHSLDDERETWVRSAATIEKEAQRLARLVDSMLFDARLAYVPLDVQPFDLLDVAEEALYALEETASQQGKQIEIDAPPQALPFSGDRDLLLRALENLIDNSIKYSAAGGTIQIQLRAEADSYEIAIHDEGEGIAPDFLPDRIFQPLVRGRSGGEGSGLGLSIVKKIVHMHSGRITADSTVGQGTTMRITLPRGEASA